MHFYVFFYSSKKDRIPEWDRTMPTLDLAKRRMEELKKRGYSRVFITVDSVPEEFWY